MRAADWDPDGKRHGGLPTYPWRNAPQGLLTRRQLREQGLRPGGQEPVAQILCRHGKRAAYLYATDKAQPVRPMTPAKQAALDKAMAARRWCPKGRHEAPYCVPPSRGGCWPCTQDQD